MILVTLGIAAPGHRAAEPRLLVAPRWLVNAWGVWWGVTLGW